MVKLPNHRRKWIRSVDRLRELLWGDLFDDLEITLAMNGALVRNLQNSGLSMRVRSGSSAALWSKPCSFR